MTFAEIADEIERRFNERKTEAMTSAELKELRKQITREVRLELTKIK